MTVIGVDRCLRNLARVAAAAEAVVAKEAEKATLEDIAAIARERMPVDTGYGRDHIVVKDGSVHADFSYAAPVEFGNPNHPAAQPFMRPAIDEVGEKPGAIAAAAALKVVV